MPTFICTTCGTQYANTDQPPVECKICTDERQYVGWQGQQWTTLEALRQSHRNVVRLEEFGLYGIGMELSFAIGQRALLVTHPDGNILWACSQKSRTNTLFFDNLVLTVLWTSKLGRDHRHLCLQWGRT